MYILGYIKSNLISNGVSSFKVFGSSLTNFKLSTKEECVINFGDGTIETVSGSNQTITHNYSSEAEYIITITGNHSYVRAPSETIEAISLSDTITHCNSMFYNCTNLTKLHSNFIIPNSVTNCSQMFYECSSLTEIPSTLVIPNSVTTCSYMFQNCSSLIEIPSTLIIPNSVTHCAGMFSGCSSLTEIPSTLIIPNSVTHCAGMFSGCSSLTEIPSTFTIPNSVNTCSYMFQNCSSLTSDISNIWPTEFTYNGTIDLTRMFFTCSKITGTVPADKLWNSGKTFSSTECFFDCRSLTNYNEIPNGWKK